MDESVYLILKNFLKKENIKINYDELKLQLLSHPSYPSLHAVTGVLTHFGVPNAALELPTNPDVYEYLPENFIGISKTNTFMSATKKERKITLRHEDGRREEVSNIAFLDIWNGVVVATDSPSEELIGKDSFRKVPKHLLYSVFLIPLIVFFVYSSPSVFEITHFVLCLLGVFISVLIAKHELGYHSKTLNKFCDTNKDTSCDAVLQSSGASVFGFLKLSDLGVIYFTGMSIAWVLIGVGSYGYTALALSTLLALPITIFSINYQYRVVKKWCPLCLGVVLVLWLQAISVILLVDYEIIFNFSLSSYVILFTAFLAITAIWLLLKPLLESGQAFKKLQIEHFKFKRNFDIFQTILYKEEIINCLIPEIRHEEIILGNKDAVLEMVMVTNPNCHYCKSAHTDLEKIFKENGDKIKLTIRFNISIADKKYDGYRVASKLLEIFNSGSKNEFHMAIHEVYLPDANLNKWLLKWGEPKNMSYDNVLEKQHTWCVKNNINFTPAILLNGREYPLEYERSDLNFFIEDLVEFDQQNHVEESSDHLHEVF